MGKALWKLVENEQRFPRRGGRVFVRPRRCQLPHGPPVCHKMAPRGGKPCVMSNCTAASSDCRRPVNDNVHIKPPSCTGRTLDLPRKDRNIKYLRPLGNSDIACLRLVSITVAILSKRFAQTSPSVHSGTQQSSLKWASTWIAIGITRESALFRSAGGFDGCTRSRRSKRRSTRPHCLAAPIGARTWSHTPRGAFTGLSGFPNAILGPFGVFRE